MSMLDNIKKHKKIGFIIHNGAQLFSNGIIQNAYFMYKCFETLGYKCEFLCHEENPGLFQYKDIKLQQICKNQLIFNPREYHTVVTITRGMSRDLYDYLKSYKIYVAGFICGNSLMHDCEDFVRSPFFKGQSTYIGKWSPVDELWVIPSYDFALEYLTLIRGPPSYIVPHLWSPCVMESVLQTKNKTRDDILFDYVKHSNKKIDILILEPNIALFKNAWIPICAAEKLHQMYPDLIHQIFVFNFPDHPHAEEMIKNLSINSKLRRFKRLAIPDILLHFNQENTFPIIVSHQINNALNYIYYEALYYGWPIVHNSTLMDGCGYQYNDNDFVECAKRIYESYNSHNRSIKSYIEHAHKYLEKIDPFRSEVSSVYDQIVNAGIAKNI